MKCLLKTKNIPALPIKQSDSCHSADWLRFNDWRLDVFYVPLSKSQLIILEEFKTARSRWRKLPDDMKKLTRVSTATSIFTSKVHPVN